MDLGARLPHTGGMRHFTHALTLCSLATLSACDPTPSGHDAAGGAPDAGVMTDAVVLPDAGPAEWRFEVIETRAVTLLEQPREAHLVRALRPDGARSYLLYIPSLRPSAPMVVFNQPYSGIDWTGEEVDTRWAARGNGGQPDDEAPGYDGDDITVYELQTPQQAADSSIVWVANQLSVVHAYGRFYAGGSIEDDILDATAPYHFALEREEIDRAHLGSWGGSWGSFMAVFGASRAPVESKPIAVGALWGPSDFSDLWAYSEALPAAFPTPATAEAFFSPYRRRILAATGGPAPSSTFAPYDREALCAGLGPTTHVLSLHDDWDTLIPVAQTQDLVAGCPQVTPLYWHRQSPIDYGYVSLDHGVSFRDEPEVPTVMTLSYAYVLDRLLPTGEFYLVMSETAFVAFLRTVHAQQMAGADASDALAPLRTLAQARVGAFTPAETFEPAADVLARAFTTVYGRAFTAASLRAELETALPTP